MNILIIEDNEILISNIKNVFLNKILINRINAITSFNAFIDQLGIIDSYDIILVDIFLGNEIYTGIDIIKLIRKKNKEIPIVVMSSCDELSMIEHAFDVGANDYLIKPLRLKELKIRIFKWFSNYFFSIKHFDSDVLKYNGLEYNLKQNKFYFNNIELELTKQNKYLLGLFLSYSENFLSKQFLTEKIWGDREITESRNIRVNIGRLKTSLKIIGIENWILTVRGEGYIFKK